MRILENKEKQLQDSPRGAVVGDSTAAIFDRSSPSGRNGVMKALSDPLVNSIGGQPRVGWSIRSTR